MKFKDLSTGNILDCSNDFVVNQMNKHTERYEPMDEEPEQPDIQETEPEPEQPAVKRGRPPANAAKEDADD